MIFIIHSEIVWFSVISYSGMKLLFCSNVLHWAFISVEHSCQKYQSFVFVCDNEQTANSKLNWGVFSMCFRSLIYYVVSYLSLSIDDESNWIPKWWEGFLMSDSNFYVSSHTLLQSIHYFQVLFSKTMRLFFFFFNVRECFPDLHM